jgi:hypothetical protein
VNFRDRLARVRRRPFSLAAEVRVLAVGLFAVAAAALWLDQSQPIAPVEVGGAALVVVAMFALNVAVGLAGVRRAARQQAATDAVES